MLTLIIYNNLDHLMSKKKTKAMRYTASHENLN